MSVRALNWAYQQPLKVNAKAVLVALAHRHHTKTGVCEPSLATLSDMTGLCERAVRYALRDLEAAGLIAARAQRRGGGFTSSRYLLRLDGPFPAGVGHRVPQGWGKKRPPVMGHHMPHGGGAPHAPNREVRSTVGEGGVNPTVEETSQEAAIIPFVRRVG